MPPRTRATAATTVGAAARSDVRGNEGDAGGALALRRRARGHEDTYASLDEACRDRRADAAGAADAAGDQARG
jgi:hypothetical protein